MRVQGVYGKNGLVFGKIRLSVQCAGKSGWIGQ
jgi:hypothetical protein